MCRCEMLDVDNSHLVKEKSLVPSGPRRGEKGAGGGGTVGRRDRVRPGEEKVEKKQSRGRERG